MENYRIFHQFFSLIEARPRALRPAVPGSARRGPRSAAAADGLLLPSAGHERRGGAHGAGLAARQLLGGAAGAGADALGMFFEISHENLMANYDLIIPKFQDI